MKRMQKIVSLLLAAVMLFALAVTVLADESCTATYMEGSKKFVFSPDSGSTPKDIFPNFKGVMPGDSLTQQIVIKNDVKNNVKIKLYIRSKGAKEGSEAFLSQLQLRVDQVGDSNLYADPADKTGDLSNWIYLGTIYAGGNIKLNLTLDVPIGLDNSFQDAVGYLEWQFKTEEFPIEQDDPLPPETGDTSDLPLYLSVMGVGALMLVALFVTRRRKKEN